MNVLFDLDGTLLDTAPDFFFALQQLRAEEKLPALSALELSKCRPAISDGMRAFTAQGFDLNKADPNLTTQIAVLSKRIIEIYHQNIGQYCQPFPGMENLLTSLEKRSIPWGVVTNKPQYLTESLLNKLGLAHRAACIVSGDTVANPKPHPEPLFYACKKLQTAPEHCVYIGDAERDIIAGKTAGMKTIAALFGYIENENLAKSWLADHYVRQASEIFPKIEDWLKEWSITQ